MSMVHADHIRAGLSLVFASGERPDVGALRAALASCQARAEIVRADEDAVELVASGLVFECDGLAPAPVIASALSEGEAGEAVRLYPGAHLSGGLTLAPVTRALLALAAELAVSLPVRAVRWHPAETSVEPAVFARSVLAWLAGGAFPATGLVALTALGDGSLASRGLAHFMGQEVTVRGSETLATSVIDRLVREGPLAGLARWRVNGVDVCAEPASHARQILVWPEEQPAPV